MTLIARVLLLSCILLYGHAFAQSPSYTPFGTGCAGSAGVPTLEADAHFPPVLGGVFRAELSNLPDGIAIGILGLSNTNWAGIALPLDLGFVGMPGCTLYTDLRIMTTLTATSGRATWDTALPSEASFLGRRFFQQALVLDASIPGLGAVMSNAAEGIIGGVSPSAPTATIAFPPPNSLTDQDSILVRGHATDPDGVAEVRVNGLPAKTADGFANWLVRVPLTTGNNSLTVYARDSLGAFDPGSAVAKIQSRSIYLDPWGIAIDLPRHRALVTDTRAGAIFAMDLTSGLTRELTGPAIGKGPGLESPRGIVIDEDRALVVDSARSAILSVDLTSGKTTLIADQDKGRGLGLLGISAIAMHGREALVVSADRHGLFSGPPRLLAVNLDTGDRRIISSFDIGAGPRLKGVFGIVVDGDRALVLEFKRLLAIDLATGNRTVLSDDNIGSGTSFVTNPSGLTLDGTQALVTGSTAGIILAIDLETGNRTNISSFRIGTGPMIFEASGIALVGDHALVVESEGPAGLEGSRVFSIDLTTGARRVLSDDGLGSGPTIVTPNGISTDSKLGQALVVQSGLASVFSVDLTSGERQAVSGQNLGLGPAFVLPLGIVQDGNRALVITNQNLFGVDLASGDRTVLSNIFTSSGPSLGSVRGFTLDQDRALIATTRPDAIFTIDLATGGRSILSDDLKGSGPSLGLPNGITIDHTRGRALIVNAKDAAIIAIDLTTGDRKTLSGKSIGSGPDMVAPSRIATDGSRAFVTDARMHAIIAIDLSSGHRKLISSADRGSGPAFSLSGPKEIALDVAWALIGGSHSRAIMAVDTQTGERVILSK